MCILRNLSYRLALEVEAAHVPLNRDANLIGEKDDDCWKKYRKKQEKRKSHDISEVQCLKRFVNEMN